MWTLSQRGDVKVVGEGVTEFTPDANGRYRIIEPTKEQRDKILSYFIKTLTTKPKSHK
jgi:putative component of toxin-antitoxin plasmid stabilization module